MIREFEVDVEMQVVFCSSELIGAIRTQQALFAAELYMSLSIEMFEDGKLWVPGAVGEVLALNIADFYRPQGL